MSTMIKWGLEVLALAGLVLGAGYGAIAIVCYLIVR